ncbi:MAG: SRPBCC family protein [Betaproteobacteria bacterium]|nr:SRPBCC family protein [Betaproteobacteria bacterium]
MYKTGVAVAMLVAANLALAHGPSRLKVTESITLEAEPDKVWAKVGNFNGLPGWHPAIAESNASDGNNVGSRRTLTLKGGGKVIEELEELDNQKMVLKYRMKEGVLPVTNYTSTLSVKAIDGGKSLVEWRGAFYRGYPNNDPPPDQNDEAAEKAITGVYKTGLENLKKVVAQ